MAVDSPKFIRKKNIIQPEISDDSIQWSESDAQELLALPCAALNDTIDSLSKKTEETSTFVAGALQKEFECERIPTKNLGHSQNRKGCVRCLNLPWILIINSLLQVRVAVLFCICRH